ncbi:MAG: DNA translocase FtsK 4TM domain-containing protein [Myxococcota bacterium]|nr:DNA translocase FtsK 4TM domain-containing protein [Myxococcota bacterium]
MAKTAARDRKSRSTAKKNAEPTFVFRLGNEIVGLLLLLISAIASLGLATYSPADPILQLVEVSNRAGAVGATLAGGLVRTIGLGSVAAVGGVAVLGSRLILGLGVPGIVSRFWVGAVALVVGLACGAPTLTALFPDWVAPVTVVGGEVGGRLFRLQSLLLSVWGAALVNLAMLAVGLLCATGVSSATALRAAGTVAAALASVLAAGAAAIAGALSNAGSRIVGSVSHARDRLREGIATFEVWREQRARHRRAAKARDEDEAAAAPLPDDKVVTELAESAVAAADAVHETPVEKPRARRRVAGEEPDIVDHIAENEAARKPSQEAFHFQESGPSGPFQLPDIAVFQAPPEGVRTYDRDSLLMNSRILEKKLADFGVLGRVVRVHPGPVITMYEYEPAAGIKVNKIVNLTDDLAMALRALSIRIIAPLPGKSVVGIEVPNPERETVYLRSLLEADDFRKSSSKLEVAMGKDIFGNVVSADLGKMPHLLVAGATGTGKSVFLNSFLCSLLLRARPDELKFLLIDPKLLELSIYEGIPHLIADVVTNPKRAAAALGGVVRKMEERYQMMSAVAVRNLAQFNERARKAKEEGETHFRLRPKTGEEEGELVEWAELPYIVVVIDELADLMVLAAKEVEESLQRLAQMARASGIHLVLATQRPSVDVLTGVIKANFPARVSFQVSSRTDSRTILDQNGAENLLGMGDMLYLPPNASRPTRIHGPFVTEKEVTELVAFLRDQGRPEFDESLLKINDEAIAAETSSGEDVDEMFDKAVAIVAETRNSSISYVQRRLKIGYNRAARIVEEMESQGMVGPQVGTKPREVFMRQVGEEEYE